MPAIDIAWQGGLFSAQPRDLKRRLVELVLTENLNENGKEIPDTNVLTALGPFVVGRGI
ncbi:hypothetical protein K8I61_17190 [bacterium]|nr:hypothetical protein [bacterium]